MMSAMTQATGDVTMEHRIRNAWLGRVSGCMLGKPVERDDLLRVTGGQTDEPLARLTIRGSKDVGIWMEAHGCWR